MKYFDMNGVPFDGSDVEKWAAEAGVEFPNLVVETVEPHAQERDALMQAKNVRMPVGMWSLVASKTQDEGVTVSDYVHHAVSKELTADS